MAETGEDRPARKQRRSLGPLGCAAVLALVAFLAAVAICIFALARHSAAEQRKERGKQEPLTVTGYEPDKRISDLDAWRLRVWGEVDKELSLTYGELKAMGMSDTDAPLNCVLGFTDYRDWRGVPIADVLERAGPRGTFITVRDDRDFSASLSLDYVNTRKPILAWEANGEPLPREHGWPIRVVAPGKYGYKWVKWVTGIEVHSRGYEGTYESSGFSLDGDADGPKTEAERRGEV
jgi:DMSO/TMAO reductase YedYZ molybdopterin-dependent catalytic subunit